MNGRDTILGKGTISIVFAGVQQSPGAQQALRWLIRHNE